MTESNVDGNAEQNTGDVGDKPPVDVGNTDNASNVDKTSDTGGFDETTKKTGDETDGEKGDVDPTEKTEKGDEEEPSEYSEEFTKMMESWAEITDGKNKELSGLAKRYSNDPVKILGALKELRAQISTGKFKKKDPPSSDNPEKLAEWREANGIPLEPDEYELPEGLQVGEYDEEMVGDFLKQMHDKNMPPDVPKDILSWYLEVEQQRVAKKAEADAEYAKNAEKEMRKKFGAEYTAKTTLVNDFLEKNFNKPFAEAVATSTEYVEAFHDIISQLDPEINVGSSTMGNTESLTTQIAALEKEIGTDAWFKDVEKQNKYKSLVDRALKMGIM